MSAAGPIRVPIALVVAVAENGVIGRSGSLPWRFKADLQRFRAITMGKPVIMGRTTFQSIGKPLPGRDNIVLSSRRDLHFENVTLARTLPAALEAAAASARANSAGEICVIGGAELFRETLAMASRLYVTHVQGSPEGDVHFRFSAEGWRAISSEALPAAPGDTAGGRLVVYERSLGASA